MYLTTNQSLFIHLVRGLSAVAVMAGHSMEALKSPPDVEWYKIQSSAVVIFFVLSGLLICFSAAKREDYSFSEYFVDRFARIYVAFVPALVLTFLIDAMFLKLGPRHSVESLIANLVMFQGIPFDRVLPGGPFFQGFGSNSPLWTVAVEWWLYMGFGIVFFSTRLRGWALLAAALMIGPVLAVVALYSLRESLSTIWILSALIAVPLVLLTPEKAMRFAWAALALSLAMAAYKVSHLAKLGSFNSYDVQLMLSFSFVILSAIAALRSIPEPFMQKAEKPILWLSGISYSLYLIHYPIMGAYLTFFPGKISVGAFLGYNAIGILAAWLFTLAFDRHHASVAKWLKRQILPRPAPAPATTA